MLGRQIRTRCGTGCLWLTVVFSIGCQGASERARDEVAEVPQTINNVIWIVADSIPAELEDRFDIVAALQMTSSGGPSDRSALLTGVDPVLLKPFPAPEVRMLPLLFRHAGYYTSREGKSYHNLGVTKVSRPQQMVERTETLSVTPGAVLGAWDAAGPEADWTGKNKDWDLPCTVSFGCGGRGRGEVSFFSLFNFEPASNVELQVSSILDALDEDEAVEATAVFLIAMSAGSGRVGVRFPQNFSHRGVVETVSLLDLAPTTLSMAGLAVPDYMTGRNVMVADDKNVVPDTEDYASASVKAVDRKIFPAPVSATPTGYPKGGLFHVAPRVELSCETPGSTIVYTTEREAPFYWRLYRGAFRMRFWELRFQCGRLGYENSDVVLYEFDIE
tara:strand:+ start:3822 stop:4985 length:1164 start_codon:yes stop_codon:yes gene_type:complete